MISTTVILKSEWLEQKKMNDPMIGRIVIIKWFNKDMKVLKISTHEEWFEGTPEEAEQCPNPSYAHGRYFDDDTEITQEILADFYQRLNDLFSIHRK